MDEQKAKFVAARVYRVDLIMLRGMLKAQLKKFEDMTPVHLAQSADSDVIAGLSQALKGVDRVLSSINFETGYLKTGDDVHLEGWAPGNLQHHLIFDHNVSPVDVPYVEDLDEIHKAAHMREDGLEAIPKQLYCSDCEHTWSWHLGGACQAKGKSHLKKCGCTKEVPE
jgi:hypothetical protein